MTNDDTYTDVPDDPQKRLEYLTDLLEKSDWKTLPAESQASVSKAKEHLAEAIAHILIVENNPEAAETGDRDVWIDESIDNDSVEAVLEDLGVSLEGREPIDDE